MAVSILELAKHVNVVATTLIKHEGKFLMVQEKKPEVYGLWNFPSGKADVGEDILTAAIREAKEETGVDVIITSIAEIAYEVWTVGEGIGVRFVFWADAQGGLDASLTTDVLQVAWKTEDELRQMVEDKQLRNNYIYRLADLALAGVSYPLDLLHNFESNIQYYK